LVVDNKREFCVKRRAIQIIVVAEYIEKRLGRSRVTNMDTKLGNLNNKRTELGYWY